MTLITRHFTVEEMACPCCGLCEMHPKFMQEIERYRVMLDQPVVVLSGMRCVKHNASLPRAVPNSCHLQGKAADIFWTKNRFAMLRMATAVFDGIGIGKTSLHVDLGGIQKIWTY